MRFMPATANSLCCCEDYISVMEIEIDPISKNDPNINKRVEIISIFLLFIEGLFKKDLQRQKLTQRNYCDV